MTNKLSKRQLRDFGLLIGFGLPLIIGWLIPLISGHEFRIWTLWISLPTLIISVFAPKILQRPYQAWMQIGNLLGYINSRIIFGIVFIAILQPIAFIMKVFGYDPLRLKKSNLLSFKEYKKDSKVDLTKIF